MDQVQLGQRGPLVSEIGFGAWAIGGMNWGPTDDEVSKRALHAAFDAGVTFVDTADVYGFGHSEKLIAEVMSDRQQSDIIIATKAGNDFYNADDSDDQGYGPIRQTYSKDYLMTAAEKSLKRLQLEALPLLQLHSPDIEKLERDEPWDALETLKRQGKLLHAGLSIQSFQETAQTPIVERHADLIDAIQVRYNLLEREAEEVLFPVAEKCGVGVIVRIPLLFGLLTGKFTRESTFTGDDHRTMNLSAEKLNEYLTRLERYRPLFENNPRQTMAQVALRFCITHPACQTVIPGAKTEQQAVDNAGAGDFGPLSMEDLEIIAAAELAAE